MKQGKFLMGNSVLSRLWNQYPDNMDACSAPERDFLPQMDDYFAGNLLTELTTKPRIGDSNLGTYILFSVTVDKETI